MCRRFNSVPSHHLHKTHSINGLTHFESLQIGAVFFMKKISLGHFWAILTAPNLGLAVPVGLRRGVVSIVSGADCILDPGGTSQKKSEGNAGYDLELATTPSRR